MSDGGERRIGAGELLFIQVVQSTVFAGEMAGRTCGEWIRSLLPACSPTCLGRLDSRSYGVGRSGRQSCSRSGMNQLSIRCARMIPAIGRLSIVHTMDGDQTTSASESEKACETPAISWILSSNSCHAIETELLITIRLTFMRLLKFPFNGNGSMNRSKTTSPPAAFHCLGVVRGSFFPSPAHL